MLPARQTKNADPTMHRYHFSIPLSIGEDPTTGNVLLGFIHNGTFIVNAFLSPSGQDRVQPEEYYGVESFEAGELEGMNRMLQPRAKEFMQEIRMDVHMGLDYPSDSTPYPIDHKACQVIARAIAVEMLRLMGQTPVEAEILNYQKQG